MRGAGCGVIVLCSEEGEQLVVSIEALKHWSIGASRRLQALAHPSAAPVLTHVDGLLAGE